MELKDCSWSLTTWSLLNTALLICGIYLLVRYIIKTQKKQNHERNA